MSRSATRYNRAAVSLLVACRLIGPLDAETARAQAPREASEARTWVAVTWDAPTGCSSAREVEARVAKLVGNAKPPEAPLLADAKLSRDDDGFWSLELTIHSGALVGERRISGKSCTDLAGAAAVTMALLLSSERPLAEADLGEQQQQPTRTPTAQPVSATHPPRPVAAAGTRWHALIGFPLASLKVDPTQALGLGAAFAGGLSYGRWSWSMQERVWLQQTLAAPQLSGVGAELHRVDATLWSCYAVARSPVEVQPCLTLSLQHLAAKGTGAYVSPRTATSTWFAGGAGAKVGYRLTPWLRLQVGVDAQIHASRPRIVVDDVGSVGQLGPADLTITLGPEWIL